MTDLVRANRVVTLSGSGGCGKTRLAIEVASDLMARFADGVCWVDLQAVKDSALVATAVADALGVRSPPEDALIDTLGAHLGGRSLLLLLDNCEQVVDGCVRLVDGLSAACPQLHVLHTSRVGLGVAGEASFAVGGLAAVDAVRLFEVRARQVVPEFRVDDANATAVAEICRRLDRIPLAVELAAARVQVLAPEQIAARLSDRFALLTSGPRGAPRRQQTLEASVQWSYDLLGDAPRLTLARLSAFAGSFELDAAAAVVADDRVHDADVLDLIAELVDQSLIQVIRRDGRARYRLLETIRMYAAERLAELDDPDRVRERHLRFHVALVRQAQLGLAGAQPAMWTDRLAADIDDLRAAMDWAELSRDVTALVSLTEPIVRFWFDRGRSRELHRRLHDAAGAAGAADGERLRALTAAAALALADGDRVSAYRSAAPAVDTARDSADRGVLAVVFAQRAFTGVLSGLSTSEQVGADVEQALRHLEHGDAATDAYVLAFAGAAVTHGRSLTEGCQLLERVVAVCEANDLAFQLPAAHASLGAAMGPGPEWAGRIDESRRHAERAVELSRSVGRPGWEAAGLAGLGAAAVLRGNHAEAQDWLEQAQATVASHGLERSQYDLGLRHWMALAAYASGDSAAARAAAAQLVHTGRGGSGRWDESIGEWLLGVIALEDGRRGEARTHLDASRALSSDPALPWPLGRALLGLAQLSKDVGELAAAWELAHDGLEVVDRYGDLIGAAAALETIADLALGLGDAERALRLLAASHRFLAETGFARFSAQGHRYDTARAAAWAALPPDGASACWEAGSALSLADAVGYARRGRGERHRPALGWESLTPVEHDVARLVAEGHSNAEIGQRLFISVNTVKKHLTHIYAKVEVAGRADLAAQVARRL